MGCGTTKASKQPVASPEVSLQPPVARTAAVTVAEQVQPKAVVATSVQKPADDVVWESEAAKAESSPPKKSVPSAAPKPKPIVAEASKQAPEAPVQKPKVIAEIKPPVPVPVPKPQAKVLPPPQADLPSKKKIDAQSESAKANMATLAAESVRKKTAEYQSLLASLGSSPVSHAGKSYGKALPVGSAYFLTASIDAKCPGGPSLDYAGIPGWRLPTKEELEELADFANKNRAKFFAADGFRGEKGVIYISSHKVSPADPKDYSFLGLKISPEGSEESFKPEPVHIYFPPHPLKARLVSSRIEAIPSLVQALKPEVFHCPMMEQPEETEWDFGDQTSEKGVDVTHAYSTAGRYTVKAKGKGWEKMQCVRVIPPIPRGEPEIVDGVTYGTPIVIGKQIWLDQDIKKFRSKSGGDAGKVINLMRGKGPGETGENSLDYSVAACPKGWRLPMKAEIEELIKAAGATVDEQFAFLTYEEGLHAELDEKGVADFVSSEVADNFAWALHISKADVNVGKQWRWSNSKMAYFSTRPISDDKFVAIISPTVNSVLLGEEVRFSCKIICHVARYEWLFGDSSGHANEEGRVVQHTFSVPGEHEVRLRLTLPDGNILEQAKRVWVGRAAQFGATTSFHGEEYGRKVAVGKQVWMTRDFATHVAKGGEKKSLVRGKGPGEKGENAWDLSVEAIPDGWRLPTKADIEELMKEAGKTQEQQVDFLCHKLGFNATLGEDGATDYVCSDQNENCAWSLRMTGTEIKVGQVWRWANSGTKFATRYMAEQGNAIGVSPAGSAFAAGKEYEFACTDQDNVASCRWNFGDGTATTEGVKTRHTYDKPGEYELTVVAKAGNGVDITLNRKIWANYCMMQQEDEVISGMNYGRPVLLGSQVWMTKDVESCIQNGKTQSLRRGKGIGEKGENDYGLSLQSAPAGWRLPTKSDIETLLAWAGHTDRQRRDFLLMPEGFHAEPDAETRSTLYVGSEIQENSALSLEIAKDRAAVGKVWRWANSGAVFATRYLACDSLHADFDWGNKDAYAGIPFVMRCRHQGFRSIKWTVDENQIPEGTNSPALVFKTVGKKRIRMEATRMDSTMFKEGREVWCGTFFGSEAETTLDLSRVQLVKIADFAQEVNSVHFTAGYAPIAPFQAGSSGAYVGYCNKENHGVVIRVETNTSPPTVSAPICDVGPYKIADLVSTPWGFVALVQDDKTKMFLQAYGAKGEPRFAVTFMDNGNEPTKRTRQLEFWGSDKDLLFGLNAMYKPSGGRLGYAKGRIAAVFAHYNHFGFHPDGKRNDHTGNTFVTFDEEGKDPKLAFSWGLSHCLRDSLIYDGMQFLSTGLGDAYPHGIRTYKCQPNLTTDEADPKLKVKNRLQNSSAEVVKDLFGDGGGRSSGRTGGLTFSGESYFLAYSSKKVTYDCHGEKNTTKTDEFALLRLDSNLAVVQKQVFGPGQRIQAINTVRYGCNILIMYKESKTEGKDAFYLCPKEDPTYAMLVSTEGKVLAGPTEMPTKFATADDCRALNDGTVVWGCQGDAGQLLLAMLKP